MVSVPVKVLTVTVVEGLPSKNTSSAARGTLAPEAPPDVAAQLVVTFQAPVAPPTQYLEEAAFALLVKIKANNKKNPAIKFFSKLVMLDFIEIILIFQYSVDSFLQILR